VLFHKFQKIINLSVLKEGSIMFKRYLLMKKIIPVMLTSFPLVMFGTQSIAQECLLDNPEYFALFCQSGLSDMSEEECYQLQCGKPLNTIEPSPECVKVKESWMGFYQLRNTCEEPIYLSINASGVEGNANCQTLYQDYQFPPASEATVFDSILLRLSDSDQLVNSYGWCQAREQDSQRCQNIFCPSENQLSEYSASTATTSPQRTSAGRTKDETRKAIANAQNILKQCEYNPGPIDGIWGQKTERAAKAFISAHGDLPATDLQGLLTQLESYNSECPNNQAQKQTQTNRNLSGYDFSDRDLSGYDFSSTDLSLANFTNSNLTATDFTGSNLTLANFSNANLTRAQLKQAQLGRANLDGVSAQGANFTEANLRNADLKNADLRDAILGGAQFSGAQISGMLFSDSSGIDLKELITSRTQVPIEIERNALSWINQNLPESRSVYETIIIGYDSAGNYTIIGD